LTGKAIVPLIKQGTRYTTSFMSQEYVVESEEERQKVEAMISDIGYYPHVTTPDEIEDLETHPEKMHELFRTKMIERVAEWVALAEERIGQSGVQFYMMPGNDDDEGIDEMITHSQFVINPVGKTI